MIRSSLFPVLAVGSFVPEAIVLSEGMTRTRCAADSSSQSQLDLLIGTTTTTTLAKDPFQHELYHRKGQST